MSEWSLMITAARPPESTEEAFVTTAFCQIRATLWDEATAVPVATQQLKVKHSPRVNSSREPWTNTALTGGRRPVRNERPMGTEWRAVSKNQDQKKP